jgi:formylglycine-generating enzyme required for sulfatase activity
VDQPHARRGRRRRKAAGKRLCTETEWQRACQTAATTACKWSTATACTTSSTSTCNTHEFDGNAAMSGDQDVLAATGGRASCYADWAAAGKIFDMTGNAKEWTAERAAGVNPLRGGSYEDLLEGSTCTFSFVAVGESYKLGNAGFRCCSDVAP